MRLMALNCGDRRSVSWLTESRTASGGLTVVHAYSSVTRMRTVVCDRVEILILGRSLVNGTAVL
jgi:hypothetical protein